MNNDLERKRDISAHAKPCGLWRKSLTNILSIIVACLISACSFFVLLAFSPRFELDDDLARRAANEFLQNLSSEALNIVIIENGTPLHIITDGEGNVAATPDAEKYRETIFGLFIPETAQRTDFSGGILIKYAAENKVFTLTQFALKTVELHGSGGVVTVTFNKIGGFFPNLPETEPEPEPPTVEPEPEPEPEPPIVEPDPEPPIVEPEPLSAIKLLGGFIADIARGKDILYVSAFYEMRIITAGENYYIEDNKTGFWEMFCDEMLTSSGTQTTPKDVVFFYLSGYLSMLEASLQGEVFEVTYSADNTVTSVTTMSGAFTFVIHFDSGQAACKIAIFEGEKLSIQIEIYSVGNDVDFFEN